MLRKVRIQNFKSLKDVTLELQKVNLLIGPNNSGKSNFLKGLEFVSKRLKSFHKNEKNAFTFMHLNEQAIKAQFLREIITIDKPTEYEVFQYINNGTESNAEVGIVEINDIYTFEDFRLKGSKTNFKLADGYPFFGGKTEYNTNDWYYISGNIIASTKLYSISTNNLTKPYPLLPNNITVKEDGSNIIAFLDIMKDEYPEVIKAINSDLNKCIPEFSEIRLSSIVLNEEDGLRKFYGDKTFKRLGLYNPERKIIFWADEVSEGILYLLALLCIIHQPNPPKLLLLEEPEKGIHPRRIHEIMKFIFQLVEDKDIQVIMTSHNEHVLEEFTTMPESVFIFDKDEEGATFVKNLQKDIIEPGIVKATEFGIEPINYTDNIGDNWFMGLMGGVPA